MGRSRTTKRRESAETEPDSKAIPPVLIGAVPIRPYAAPIARRFHQVCLSATAEPLRSEDLVPLQWGVVAELNAKPEIDQSDLAARLGVDRTNAGLLVDQLEKRGLVTRQIHPNDRRVRHVSLTSEGAALFARLFPRIIAVQRSILEAALTKAEAKMLLSLLVRVIQANEQHARPGGGRRNYSRALPSTASIAIGTNASNR